jgi:hypothetical protein
MQNQGIKQDTKEGLRDSIGQLFYWTPEINLLKVVRPCLILGKGLNCYSMSQTSARGLQGVLGIDTFRVN